MTDPFWEGLRVLEENRLWLKSNSAKCLMLVDLEETISLLGAPSSSSVIAIITALTFHVGRN